MDGGPKSWLDKLLGAAVVLAISAWLIRWAVAAVQPLLPVLIVLAAVVIAGTIAWRLFRGRQGEW